MAGTHHVQPLPIDVDHRARRRIPLCAAPFADELIQRAGRKDERDNTDDRDHRRDSHDYARFGPPRDMDRPHVRAPGQAVT